MHSEQQLRDMFAQAQAMPDGPAKFQALDMAIRHADASGDAKLAFEFRHESIETFTFGGDDRRAFLAFSQSLAAYDRDPTVADDYSEHTILWQFKWVVNALPDFPDIPLDRTYAVLDDMQRRYLLGGHSLHAVHQARWQIAMHVGDFDAAARSYHDMVTSKMDSLANCSVCVPSAQTRYLSEIGKFEEAVKVGGPVKRGWCRRQPRWVQAYLMLPYLNTGQHAEAAEAHRNSYRQMRTDHTDLGGIGLHLTFLGRSGNETRGLEVVEKHLPWLEVSPSPADSLQFAAPAALVLNRLSANGFGDTTLLGRASATGRRQETTVDALRGELAAFARDLAAKFDARNGTSHQSELAERRMTAEPVAEHVSLSVMDSLGTKKKAIVALQERIAEHTQAGDVEGAARARLDAAIAMSKKNHPEAIAAAEEAAIAVERAGLTGLVREAKLLLWDLYREAYAYRDTAKSLFDELLPDAEPREKARLTEQSAKLYWGDERAERFIAAADLYRETGDPDRELRALGEALAANGDLALLERAETLREQGNWLKFAMRAAESLAYHDLHEQALPLALEVAQSGAKRQPRAAHLVCQLLLVTNRPAEAETRARELLTATPDKKKRDVHVLLTRALLAQDPSSAEAAELVASNNIKDWELAAPDDEDEYGEGDD
ncbi:tetratricopeptide repeat protein [Catelliglobosispora koreensis]|uniref:tetratricopeptide repeat protein n=1 Tax=Catelliglobosispora koreensis TaxID=129052 RepID=UPI00037AADF9|nr:hypothetical protein [Catelliglobosispora koreensis]